MAASVQDMGINHGRAGILVPKEFLDGADVIACFKQMRGKGMSEIPIAIAIPLGRWDTCGPGRWASIHGPIQSAEYAPAIEGSFHLPFNHANLPGFHLNIVGTGILLSYRH
jgi:hypothetical protein